MRYIALFLAFFFNLFSGQRQKLTDYSSDVYSQYGEDGIIKKIFEIIGTKSKLAVEFGAWDGFCLSNTANLWTNDPEWKAVLIECDPALFQQLVSNTNPYHCVTLHKKVGISPIDSLESILSQAGIRSPIDILSIDIDGNDYYILQSLQLLRPRLIVCEYNCSIPAHLDIYPDYDNFIGSSVAALERIAAEKGYSLIALTDTNCFFVLNEELPKFADFIIDREHIRIDKYVSYIISDYSGKYKVVGPKNFKQPWGWIGIPSLYHCNGQYTSIPRQVR